MPAEQPFVAIVALRVDVMDGGRHMSDYQNFDNRDPNDPLQRRVVQPRSSCDECHLGMDRRSGISGGGAGGRFRNRSPAEPNEHRIQRHSAAGGNAYDTADPCSGTEPNDHSRANFARA